MRARCRACKIDKTINLGNFRLNSHTMIRKSLDMAQTEKGHTPYKPVNADIIVSTSMALEVRDRYE